MWTRMDTRRDWLDISAGNQHASVGDMVALGYTPAQLTACPF